MSARSKRWRKENPEARAKQRNAYYQRHVYGTPLNRTPYTVEENFIILTKRYKGKHILDRDMAKMMKRSVKGIQVRRTILKRRA